MMHRDRDTRARHGAIEPLFSALDDPHGDPRPARRWWPWIVLAAIALAIACGWMLAST